MSSLQASQDVTRLRTDFCVCSFLSVALKGTFVTNVTSQYLTDPYKTRNTSISLLALWKNGKADPLFLAR